MTFTEQAVEAAAKAVSVDWENHVPGMRLALKAAEPHFTLDRAKSSSHLCEEGAGTWVGKCILPLDHNPIVPGLGHINGRGELFVGSEPKQPNPAEILADLEKMLEQQPAHNEPQSIRQAAYRDMVQRVRDLLNGCSCRHGAMLNWGCKVHPEGDFD